MEHTYNLITKKGGHRMFASLKGSLSYNNIWASLSYRRFVSKLLKTKSEKQTQSNQPNKIPYFYDGYKQNGNFHIILWVWKTLQLYCSQRVGEMHRKNSDTALLQSLQGSYLKWQGRH